MLRASQASKTGVGGRLRRRADAPRELQPKDGEEGKREDLAADTRDHVVEADVLTGGVDDVDGGVGVAGGLEEEAEDIAGYEGESVGAWFEAGEAGLGRGVSALEDDDYAVEGEVDAGADEGWSDGDGDRVAGGYEG